MLLHLVPHAPAVDERDVPQVQRSVVLIAFAVIIFTVGAVLAGGGRERSTCPHNAGPGVVQPKEGPGRPPSCAVKGH
jgi:hypothetical protein